MMVFPFIRQRHVIFLLVIQSIVIGFSQFRIYHDFSSNQDLQKSHENVVSAGSHAYNRAFNDVSFRPTFPYNDTYKPPNTPGAFVHVGKTGGSSLSQLLRYGCHSFMLTHCDYRTMSAKDESIISKLTTYYHVPDFEKGTNQSYEFYVITIRDPLDRIVSAYLESHPENLEAFVHYNILNNPKYRNLLENEGPEAAQQYYDNKWRMEDKRIKFSYFRGVYECMPTLDTFAQMLKGGEMMEYKNKTPANKWLWQIPNFNCSEKSKLIFFHKNAPRMNHFYWNLQSIVQSLNINIHQSSIFLIRTEHMNQDWIQANQYLGQKAENVKVPEVNLRNASTYNYPVQNTLSDSGREMLCQALKPEYELFMKLLSSAVNLSTEQKQESLNMVQKKCPWLSLKL